jgi:hypothetical protein
MVSAFPMVLCPGLLGRGMRGLCARAESGGGGKEDAWRRTFLDSRSGVCYAFELGVRDDDDDVVREGLGAAVSAHGGSLSPYEVGWVCVEGDAPAGVSTDTPFRETRELAHCDTMHLLNFSGLSRACPRVQVRQQCARPKKTARATHSRTDPPLLQQPERGANA